MIVVVALSMLVACSSSGRHAATPSPAPATTTTTIAAWTRPIAVPTGRIYRVPDSVPDGCLTEATAALQAF
ncbi:MAG TPA: hypothetical protein VFR41_16105, partial [Acidimicrobiia bacterium]|nr:hypothetical protein [Acidimicrobiia bacterium]